MHEGLAVGKAQSTTFASDCLSDQEVFGLGVVEASRVELVEFHVGDPTAGPPGHGDAIAGGAVWITGIKVDFAGAAGSQHHKPGTEELDVAGVPVQHISTDTSVAGQKQLAMGDLVNPNAVFQNIHIWTLFDLLTEGGGHYKAGRIGRVDDAATAVASFFSQVIGKAAVVIAFFFSEAHALFNKPLNRIAAVFDSEPYGVFVAEARPGA